MPLGGFEGVAHGDLMIVLGYAERVVVRVGLEIADVVVRNHVSHRCNALDPRENALDSCVLTLFLAVGSAPDCSCSSQ